MTFTVNDTVIFFVSQWSDRADSSAILVCARMLVVVVVVDIILFCALVPVQVVDKTGGR